MRILPVLLRLVVEEDARVLKQAAAKRWTDAKDKHVGKLNGRRHARDELGGCLGSSIPCFVCPFTGVAVAVEVLTQRSYRHLRDVCAADVK